MKKFTKKVVSLALTSALVLSVCATAMAGEYVVQKGDYLSKIAPKYETTWQELAKLNKLANPNLIYPNQVLQVPDLAKPETPAPVVPETPAPVEPVEEPKAEKVELTSLKVEDITHTNNGIEPDFSADVKSYTMNVQSDIYGVKVTPVASEGAVITVNGVEAVSGEGTIVKLADTYEFYSVDYSLKIEIVVTKGEETAEYNVEVVRENAADVYALFEEKEYNDDETGLKMPYEIYVPSNYDETKEYPIVFALHGSGQRAQSLDMVLKRYEMATVWAKDSENGINECIVLAPQCASKDDSDNWTSLMTFRSGAAETAYEMTNWSVAAYNLLEKTLEEYSIDKDRVYMTGLSAGGFATFTIAVEHPEMFAALVPVCGGANPEKVEVLKGIPMWIFHAEDDPTVGVEEFLYPTLEALDKNEIEYKLTEYQPGTVFVPSAHFSWVPAYADENMRNWLFEQSK